MHGLENILKRDELKLTETQKQTVLEYAYAQEIDIQDALDEKLEDLDVDAYNLAGLD